MRANHDGKQSGDSGQKKRFAPHDSFLRGAFFNFALPVPCIRNLLLYAPGQ
jgi:hypothetical protein